MADEKPDEKEIEKLLDKAKTIANDLKKVEQGSFFSFDKDYACSNSVDRDFLQSLIEKKDFNEFSETYLNG